MNTIHLHDPKLERIAQKVFAGERLTFEDGLYLLKTPDLHGLGYLARERKKELSGEYVYFVVNQYINHTNVCVLSCKFCDFARKEGEEGSYTLTIDEIVSRVDPEVREIHITGGHHPSLPFSYYEELIATLHERFSHAQIKAFTAAEIDYFERRWKIPVDECLKRFYKAGLRLLPGGGAEILTGRLHKILYPGKASPERWLEIHRIAHKIGIKSNCTMLFGHIETPAERIEHMLKIRSLQDETGGFQNFIPLTYQPGSTQLVSHMTSGVDELRTIATARLILDNIPHIQAYWVTLGEEIAGVALHYGADDLNGTLGQERIMHAAGARTPTQLTRERLVRLIREAGWIPVERDALFRKLALHTDRDLHVQNPDKMNQKEETHLSVR